MHGVRVNAEAHDSITFPNRHVPFIAYLPRQFHILMLKMGRFLRFAKKKHQPQMSFER